MTFLDYKLAAASAEAEAPAAAEPAAPPPEALLPAVAGARRCRASAGAGGDAGRTAPPKYTPPSKLGLAFMVGGGYEDFANNEMRDWTNPGGAWNFRFVAGTRLIIGVEGAYVGSARGFQSLGVTANNPTLISNGVEGNLRLNAPITKGNSLFEPYAIAGVGWAQYHISNYNSNTQALSDFSATNDNVLTVPLGAGFTYGYKALMLDVRGTYSPTYYNNLLRGDQWHALEHLGRWG